MKIQRCARRMIFRRMLKVHREYLRIQSVFRPAEHTLEAKASFQKEVAAVRAHFKFLREARESGVTPRTATKQARAREGRGAAAEAAAKAQAEAQEKARRKAERAAKKAAKLQREQEAA